MQRILQQLGDAVVADSIPTGTQSVTAPVAGTVAVAMVLPLVLVLVLVLVLNLPLPPVSVSVSVPAAAAFQVEVKQSGLHSVDESETTGTTTAATQAGKNRGARAP